MRLNNKGFGMKETLIYLSILLLVLLIASCSISSFYDDLESDREDEYVPSYTYENDDEEDEIIVDDEDEKIEINYAQYYIAEANFKDAAELYANAYELRDSLTTLKLEDVERAGYLEKDIVDVVDGSKCTGYANVEYEDIYGGRYNVDVFISCANYRTEGYR